MDNYFIYAFTLIQVNTLLKNNIEGIILKWSYQVYINNIKNEEKDKTFKLSIPDGGGVEQGFCRRPQQGAESWPDD